MQFVRELWDSFAAKVVGAIFTPIIIAAAYYLYRRVYRAFQAYGLARAALKAIAREQENGRWLEGPGFWLKQPIVPPWNDYDRRMQASIPILMVATAKGGVGKTTLSGSLAGYFAIKWRQTREDPQIARPVRVLLIDSDFQASMSTMTVPDNERNLVPSKANTLISGEIGNGLHKNSTPRVNRPDMLPISAWVVPAYYDLAQAENRVMVEWLLPLSDSDLLSWLFRVFNLKSSKIPRSRKDVRYLLAEALQDPIVQQEYDIVLIDSPPRLTTSHIQALCASTHILIPTILDRLSGDAVARYVDQVATHVLGPPRDRTRAICPHLRILGVVCNMIQPTMKNVSGPINVLRQSLAYTRMPAHIFEEFLIRYRAPYRECAGERIAYAAVERSQTFEELRAEVDRLGAEISQRMGVAGKGWIPSDPR